MSHRSFSYLVVYLLPACVWAHLVWGGLWSFAAPAVVVVLAPALDALLPERSPRADVARGQGHAPWLGLMPLRLWPAVHIVTLVFVLEDVSGPLGAQRGWVRPLSLAVAMGTMAGVGGINIAHELLHRKARGDRALAELLMTWVCYPHFCVEHIAGHHRYVGTVRDPATARRGESVYRFVLRSVFGSFSEFWKRERRRCRSAGVFVLSLRNRRFRYAASVGLLAAVWVLVWGFGALGFWLAQSVIAVCMLEIINYVEHYGLEREMLPSGQPARVQAQHSWNSRARFSNWILFNLPLHADHHHSASKPYWELEARDGAPVFPAGYGTMLLLALVPPLWRKAMHPLLDQYGTPRS